MSKRSYPALVLTLSLFLFASQPVLAFASDRNPISFLSVYDGGKIVLNKENPGISSYFEVGASEQLVKVDADIKLRNGKSLLILTDLKRDKRAKMEAFSPRIGEVGKPQGKGLLISGINEGEIYLELEGLVPDGGALILGVVDQDTLQLLTEVRAKPTSFLPKVGGFLGKNIIWALAAIVIVGLIWAIKRIRLTSTRGGMAW